MDKMNKIKVFTDGSSTVYHDKDNLRYGGIGVFFSDNSKYNISKSMIGKNVSNQRAELSACIEAIKMGAEIMKTDKTKDTVLIYSDSQYAIKSATEWVKKWKKNGWKKSDGKEILNLDLIKSLDILTTKYKVEFVHIRSHQKEPLNEPSNERWNEWYGNNEADRLAGEAMKSVNSKC